MRFLRFTHFVRFGRNDIVWDGAAALGRKERSDGIAIVTVRSIALMTVTIIASMTRNCLPYRHAMRATSPKQGEAYPFTLSHHHGFREASKTRRTPYHTPATITLGDASSTRSASIYDGERTQKYVTPRKAQRDTVMRRIYKGKRCK